MKAIAKHPVRLISISLFLFLLVYFLGLVEICYILGCLSFLFWGVCRVSGRFLGVVLGCLNESGYCLGGGII